MGVHEPDEERDLLQRIAQNDEKAFARLFHAWRDKLYFFTLRFTQSPRHSEDLVQEAFVKIWLQRENLHEITNFSAWLYRLIRNQAISNLRRIALESSLMDALKAESIHLGNPVDEILIHKQLQEKLREAIDLLPPRQKQIYTLTRIDGMKQEEVAGMLNISISTLQNHMTEALRKLKIILAKDYPSISILTLCLLFR